MTKFILIIMTLTFWGSVSMANVPATQDGLTEQCETAKAFTNHLNHYYGDLNVKVDLSNPAKASTILDQLNQLEDIMQGKYSLPDGTLNLVECTRCACIGCIQ